MYIALWIVQVLVALGFLFAGGAKIFTPIEKLHGQMAWTNHASAPVVRLVGILELLGAVGLILPVATRIAPVLTPIAAICLVITMIVAIVIHLRLNDAKGISAPLVLLLLSLFIAIGYLVIVPVA
jgi:uncharacterized membrane protein YphA (DoxX/SURF4 family)